MKEKLFINIGVGISTLCGGVGIIFNISSYVIIAYLFLLSTFVHCVTMGYLKIPDGTEK